MAIKFIDFNRFLVGAGNGTLMMYSINEENKVKFKKYIKKR